MLYPTDDSRIAFVCSPLTGRALEWATVVWREDHSVFPSFSAFILRFKEVYEDPAGGKEAGEQLLSLCQGRSPVADYALSFRTLAAQTGWLDDPLRLHFRRRLSPELESELACRDEGRSLDQFIELSIRIDNLLRSRRLTRFSSAPVGTTLLSPDTEPMQIGFTHLSKEVRETHSPKSLLILRSIWTHESYLSHSSTTQFHCGELES